MNHWQEEADFTADRPFSLTIGPGDSGQALEYQYQQLAVKGIIKIHLHLAKTKSFKRISLHLTSAIDGDHESLDEYFTIWDARGPQPLPQPGEQVLRVPFSIPLPYNIEPLGGYRKALGPLGVRYMVTLRAERRRLMGGDAIITREVSIPPALFTKLLLHDSVRGDLKREAKSDVSRPACTDQGSLCMRMLLPGGLRPLPLDTDIPFIIKIKTVSMLVAYADDPIAALDLNALTPTIKATQLHQVLRLKLIRQTRTPIPGSQQSQLESVGCATLGNLAEEDVDVDVWPREWRQDASRSNMGRWIQEFTFRSHFYLPSDQISPTFICRDYSINYELELCGWFPMFENPINGTRLKLSAPVEICPPHPIEDTRSSRPVSLPTNIARAGESADFGNLPVTGNYRRMTTGGMPDKASS
ncbi:hypothetical protein HWV62_19579 [Athelia sp. TMB]|nr:hypothetical protein HWV62_19579 [Athelia sp. TMB]